MPSSPVSAMASATASSMVPGVAAAPSAAAKLCTSASARNGAISATSPWEKWMMFSTPNSRLKPTAIRA